MDRIMHSVELAAVTRRGSRRGSVVIGLAAAALLAAGAGYLVGRPSTADLSAVSDAVAGITVTQGEGGALTGSAIVLTSSGEALTAFHLVGAAERIAVDLSGRRLWASPVAFDPSDDLAVVDILGAHGLAPAPLAPAGAPAVGDRVSLVGYGGSGGSAPVTATATVTAVGQSVTSSDPDSANPISLSGVFQVTSQTSLSGDGGAVVDASGRVVGMFSAGADRLRGTIAPTVGYALPMTAITPVVTAVETGASDWHLDRGTGGYLGIDVVDAPGADGALVTAVPLGTPAYVAGLIPGDVIVALGGTVRSAEDLSTVLRKHQGGDRVWVSYVDPSGKQHSVLVELAAGTSD